MRDEIFITGLAEAIGNDNGEPTKYNSSVREPKSFTGNIVMFGNSPEQYKKRFHRGACCGVHVATDRDMVERKDEIEAIPYSVGVLYVVDNMVKWEFKGSKVTICCECGWIDSEQSTVKVTTNQTAEDNEDSEPTPEELAEIENSINSYL